MKEHIKSFIAQFKKELLKIMINKLLTSDYEPILDKLGCLFTFM